MSEANNEKILRLVAKKSFGRAKKCLLDLIEANAGEIVVNSSYNKMEEAFNKLELAHVEYLQVAKIDIDVDDAEANYLDTSGAEKMSAEVEYRKYIKVFEEQKKMQKDKKKFNSELAALLSSMESFGKPSEYITQLCESKLISHDDMREEVKKIEEKVEKLIEGKKNLASLDPTADLNDIRNRLENCILKEVQVAKKKATMYIYNTDHAQDKKKFKSELAAFIASMDNFGKPSENIAHLCESKIISHDAIREEVKKTEEKLDKLLEGKKHLASLDPTADLNDIRHRLENDIVKDVQEAKKNAMIYITTSDLVQTPPCNRVQTPTFDHEQTHISGNTSTLVSSNVTTPVSDNVSTREHVYTPDYISGGKTSDVKRPTIKPTMTGSDFFIFIGDWETYKESEKIETKNIPLELYRAADDDLKKLLEKKKLLKKFSSRTEKDILDLYRSLTVQDKFRPKNLIQMIDLTGIKTENLQYQEEVADGDSTKYANTLDTMEKNRKGESNVTKASPIWKSEQERNDRIISGRNSPNKNTNMMEEGTETSKVTTKRKMKDKQLDGRKVAKVFHRKKPNNTSEKMPAKNNIEEQISLRNIRNIKEIAVGNAPKREIDIKKCPDEMIIKKSNQAPKQLKGTKQKRNPSSVKAHQQKKVKVSAWLDANRKQSIYKKNYKQKKDQLKGTDVSITSRIRAVSQSKKICSQDQTMNNGLPENPVSAKTTDSNQRLTRLSVRLRKKNQSWSVASSPSI